MTKEDYWRIGITHRLTPRRGLEKSMEFCGSLYFREFVT
jgi:hypothetical protein